ncbi:hypothetical protein [Bacillus altitudinis]|uniref:hypothetical protein n=1 Tax=Bacillus altitudinis TaxID=293387 RepID=UPI0015BF73BA|nr:hypothetical protein [Bacillus altitudinis]
MEIGLGNSNDFIFRYDVLPIIKSIIGRSIKTLFSIFRINKGQILIAEMMAGNIEIKTAEEPKLNSMNIKQ